MLRFLVIFTRKLRVYGQFTRILIAVICRLSDGFGIPALHLQTDKLGEPSFLPGNRSQRTSRVTEALCPQTSRVATCLLAVNRA